MVTLWNTEFLTGCLFVVIGPIVEVCASLRRQDDTDRSLLNSGSVGKIELRMQNKRKNKLRTVGSLYAETGIRLRCT